MSSHDPAILAPWVTFPEAGFGINVIGHVSGNLGLGVSARGLIQTLQDHQVPIAVFDIDPGLGRGGQDLTFESLFVKDPADLPYPVNLFVMPPNFGWVFSSYPDLRDRTRLNAAFSAWEIPALPQSWIEFLQTLDVLLATSDYVRSIYDAHVVLTPTISVPQPLTLPDAITPNRSHFGFSDSTVVFLAAYEPYSDPERKNISGAILAFQEAFPPGRGDVSLVIKINNAQRDGVFHPSVIELQRRAAADPRIRLITERMSYRETMTLFASCDVFVSLHRAEGFGLTLAETMALGKPVIATDWSGNMSFMDQASACLVRHQFVRLAGSNEFYSEEFLGRESYWADPSTRDAAAWMVQLADSSDLRSSIGQAAKERIVQYQAIAHAGRWIGELYAIWKSSSFLPVIKGKHSNPINQVGVRNFAYQEWLAKRSISKSHAQLWEQYIADWGKPPAVHVVILAAGGGTAALAATINSLAQHYYPHTRITIGLSSPMPGATDSDHLRWRVFPQLNITEAVRTAVSESADWTLMLSPGDLVERHALLFYLDAAHRNPEAMVLYGDDDLISSDGSIDHPRFKPDINPDLLRSSPGYMGKQLLFKTSILSELNAENAPIGISDVLFRIMDKYGEKAFSHIPLITTHRGQIAESILDTADTELESLKRHLNRINPEAQLFPGLVEATYRVRYPATREPLVTVVIPTRNQLPLLRRCVESLLERTSYQNFEIVIVDNESTDTQAVDYLDGIASLNDTRLRVHRFNKPFNYSAMNNEAAKLANGEYLLLLNNDTEIIQAEWLSVMVEHALRPEVAAVGARLTYPDGTVQHAGIVLGMLGPAEHIFHGQPIDAGGYMGRALVDQNYSAITGACMLIRRSVFDAVGGLDDVDLRVGYSDIDLCLKIRRAGYSIVWTPYALVLHEGSASQKAGVESGSVDSRIRRFQREQDIMYQRWLPQLAADSAYNCNLSLRRRDTYLEVDAALNWNPLPWRPLPVLLAQPADRQACGYYRITAPLQALSKRQYVLGMDSQNFYSPAELARIAPDSVLFQRPYTDAQFEFIERTARYTKAFKVLELDDLISQIPSASVHRSSFPSDVASRLKRSAALCDRMVVSTQALADALRNWSADIRVVPNFLPTEHWAGLSPRRRTGRKPRVGWAGALGHEGDLGMLEEVVTALADEVDWIILGKCPESFRIKAKEVKSFVTIEQYPAALARLELDVAIAPLEINAFNEAKSALKILEYGALGYPVVCSDITPYQGSFPVTRVRNRPKDWIEAIRALAHDAPRAAQEGDRLRNHVTEHWLLEDHLDEWAAAWLN